MNGHCQTFQWAHRHLQAVGLSHAVLQSVPLHWIRKSRGAGGQHQQSPIGRMEPALGFTGGAGSHAATPFLGALRNLSSSEGSLRCQLTLSSRASWRTSLHIPAGAQLSKTYAEIHHSPMCQLHVSILHIGTAPSPNCAYGLPLLSMQKHSCLTWLAQALWFFREVLWHPRWPCIGPSDMWEIPDDVPVLLATKQARCMATIPRKCSPSSPARKIAMLYAGLPSFHTLPQQSVQIQHLHESIEIEENTSPF